MTDAQRREIPIFPLNTVLFPGGVLPLKIFEQRYLDMTKACLRDDAPFGVCLIREGQEVGTPAVPAQVGCLASIAQWDMPQLGVFHLVARGGARFRILETRTAANGLITAEIEMFREASSPPMDPTCREVLGLIIEKVGADQFPPPLELDDPAWVAFRLAEVLPLGTAVRQQILEMADGAQRFARLHQALLEQGLVS